MVVDDSSDLFCPPLVSWFLFGFCGCCCCCCWLLVDAAIVWLLLLDVGIYVSGTKWGVRLDIGGKIGLDGHWYDGVGDPVGTLLLEIPAQPKSCSNVYKYGEIHQYNRKKKKWQKKRKIVIKNKGNKCQWGLESYQ